LDGASRAIQTTIYKFLEENYLPDLRKHIVTEHHIDPLHFQDTLNSYLGSAFSVEPTLYQSAYLRPHNRSEDIENLYFRRRGNASGRGTSGRHQFGKNRRQYDWKSLAVLDYRLD
jgi:phytoene desaturase